MTTKTLTKNLTPELNLDNSIVSKLCDKFPVIMSLDYEAYSDAEYPDTSYQSKINRLSVDNPDRLAFLRDSDVAAAFKLAVRLSTGEILELPALPPLKNEAILSESEEVEESLIYWSVSDCGSWIRRKVGEEEQIRTIDEWQADASVSLPSEVLKIIGEKYRG
ncbi:hypothetical protein IQ250_02860 [Pseudanabaenaceae cyanobacterium LEGE 13415]|nr:hypothetical protein [Pseudanabaenaceae cyanobacterium LEGE 13415]